MGSYDDIAIPIPGQKISVGTFGVPVRNAIRNLDSRVSLREAAELLPANVTAFGNGNNTLAGAATVYTTLPTNPASAVMANPSTDFNLVVNVFFGCWMSVTSGDVRMGIALSGGLTISPPNNPGVNQPSGHGLYPFTQSTSLDQHMGFMQVTIPPNVAAVTFTAQGSRSIGTATAQVNYPSINLVPDRFTL